MSKTMDLCSSFENGCTLFENSFGRWVLVSEMDQGLAWSGSRWVPHFDGIPTGAVQIVTSIRKIKPEYTPVLMSWKSKERLNEC